MLFDMPSLVLHILGNPYYLLAISCTHYGYDFLNNHYDLQGHRDQWQIQSDVSMLPKCSPLLDTFGGGMLRLNCQNLKVEDEYYGVCTHVYHKQGRGHCMRRFKVWKSYQDFGFCFQEVQFLHFIIIDIKNRQMTKSFSTTYIVAYPSKSKDLVHVQY